MDASPGIVGGMDPRSEAGGEAPPSAPAILIVEDDAQLAAMIADYLRQNGLKVEIESRGDRAAPRILASQPSLVVLDLMLPGDDGLSICRKIHGAYAGRVLTLTARGDEIDEVVGLELGADDYLAKPVRPRVLLARIRALLRRPPDAPPSGRLEAGGLSIDPATRQALAGDARLDLTAGEFDLLWLLASHAGQVLGRKFLFQELIGGQYDDFDRTIDLRVSRLRTKLAAALGDQDTIKTLRGSGYLYVRR